MFRSHNRLLFALWLLLVICIPPSQAEEPGNVHLFLPLLLHPGTVTVASGPSWNTPLALIPGDAHLWVANPDAGTVSVVDTASLTKIDEIAVGGAPWSVAVSPDGKSVYVVLRDRGELVVIDTENHQLQSRLIVGPEPGGLALSPRGTQAFVTVSASHRVAVIDTGRMTITAQIEVGALPYAIAVSNDGDAEEDDERIYVTHLLALPRPGGSEGMDDGREGRVTVLDAASLTVLSQVSLAPDVHGFPNLLSSVTLSGGDAWLPQVRAAPALPNGLTTTVFAAVSRLDLASLAEAPNTRLALNDETIFGSPVNNPVAAIPSPDGQTLFVVLAGSDLVEVVDVTNPTQPHLLKFLPVGKNPRGMAVDAEGRRGYVMNYLSRSITVLDLVGLQVVDEVQITEETLDAQLLQGKILFNNATNPRVSRGSWISCASCHPDGGSDGVTWFFPDGPRQSPPIWNAGHTLPWHWSAALDEAQDVEDTIHVIQHGLGLAPGADPGLLGAPNTGRSAALDALAAFLVRGIRPPSAPAPIAEATEGRRLFGEVGCATCHGGPHWTISALPGPPGTLDPDGNGMVDSVLRNVGTFNPADIRGASGFDVPSLLGIGLTAPYFHDGSMPSLEALLTSGHPDPDGAGNGLSKAEIGLLTDFLLSIDTSTTPFTTQP